MNHTFLGPVALFAFALLTMPSTQRGPHTPDQRLPSDSSLVREFQTHVAKYVALHKGLDRPPAPTADPAIIRASQSTLADKIRFARRDAHRGEIFTPAIGELFQRLLRQTMSDATRTGDPTATTTAETPATLTLQVNASYPEGAPVPSVPPQVLAALPELPSELEYRIVRSDLILLDAHARLIVDFIPGAIR